MEVPSAVQGGAVGGDRLHEFTEVAHVPQPLDDDGIVDVNVVVDQDVAEPDCAAYPRGEPGAEDPVLAQ